MIDDIHLCPKDDQNYNPKYELFRQFLDYKQFRNTSNKDIEVNYSNMIFITNKFKDFTSNSKRISNKLLPIRLLGNDSESTFNIFFEIALSHAKGNGFYDEVTNSLKVVLDQIYEL